MTKPKVFKSPVAVSSVETVKLHLALVLSRGGVQ
jgi:hypothetical protein